MSAAPIPWKHLRNVLVLFAPVWVGATVLFGIAGMGYALIRQDVWAARLPIVVRDEATTAVERLGRFASQSDLKAAQETLLEMARNPEVVGAALAQIGPPDGHRHPDWPSLSVIEGNLKSNVNLVAPKGSEFGNSEVVYLQVKGETQQRTIDFCRAIFDNLAEHLRQVRRVRADSIISELTHARNLAIQNLDEVSSRMREIEIQFGTDLGELRNLNDTISGDGTNRRTLEETTVELQAAELSLEKMEELNKVLIAGANDPQQLLISDGDVLSSQPSLQRLKDGLIDAQLLTSKLSGVFTEANPKRRAAIATEKEIKSRIQQEAAVVSLTMKPTIRLERERVNRLREKQTLFAKRLKELAEGRANYAKIDAEVRHRTALLGEAERHLSDAQASRSAALSTNLIAELGPPQVTDNPVGPGGTTLVAGSTLAGMLFGLGMVFLVAPGPNEGYGRRRWSDYLTGYGRRASDAVAAGSAVAPENSMTPGGPGAKGIREAANWPVQDRRRG